MGQNILLLLPVLGTLIATLVMLRGTKRPAATPKSAEPTVITVKLEVDAGELDVLTAHMDATAQRLERACRDLAAATSKLAAARREHSQADRGVSPSKPLQRRSK